MPHTNEPQTNVGLSHRLMSQTEDMKIEDTQQDIGNLADIVQKDQI